MLTKFTAYKLDVDYFLSYLFHEGHEIFVMTELLVTMDKVKVEANNKDKFKM